MKRGFGAGFGGIMVFTVLAVLCVAVFAALTMSSALADLRLSEKTARMTAQYYELDAAGVRLLCRAEQLWPEGEPAPKGDIFLRELQGMLPDGEEITVSPYDGGVLIGALADVGESRTFEISAILLAAADPKTGSRWVIERWSLGPQGFDDKEIDFGMPVWPGN